MYLSIIGDSTLIPEKRRLSADEARDLYYQNADKLIQDTLDEWFSQIQEVAHTQRQTVVYVGISDNFPYSYVMDCKRKMQEEGYEVESCYCDQDNSAIQLTIKW